MIAPPAAVARFHAGCPGVELKLRTAALRRGVRSLADGKSDLHCGGIDAGDPLPPFLRRDHFLDATAGRRRHARAPAPTGLAGYPWRDFDAPSRLDRHCRGSSPAAVLENLHDQTSRRVRTVIRAGSAGLFLMAAEPHRTRVPLDFLRRCPGPRSNPCRSSP